MLGILARVVVFAVVFSIIAAAVWALFQLGNFLGLQWYVSAVAILLKGHFLTSSLFSHGTNVQ